MHSSNIPFEKWDETIFFSSYNPSSNHPKDTKRPQMNVVLGLTLDLTLEIVN